MTKQQLTPNFQPISIIPVISKYIDGALKDAKEHYQTLQEAEARPFSLDDVLVNRISKVFTEQKQDLRLFDEQLSRWKKG